MKLSEKGKENLQAFGFAHNCDGAFSLLDDYEFDQDDFEGAVCLTVEEAKRLHDCAMWFWCDYEGTQYFTHDDMRFLTDMKDRIEQAEAQK